MEVGEIEAQAVTRGCSQGPALLLVVGILPWEARGRQAPEHRLGPLRAHGCGCRAPQQAQEDERPEGSTGGWRGPGGLLSALTPASEAVGGSHPPHGAPVQLSRPGLDSRAVSPLICLSNTWPCP